MLPWGRVTVAGKPSDELAPGTLRSIEKQSRFPFDENTYAVVIEPAGSGFSAYVPDLPGCCLQPRGRAG